MDKRQQDRGAASRRAGGRQRGAAGIAIALAALLNGGVALTTVVVTRSHHDVERFDTTRADMVRTAKAIADYAVVNGRLPCPDVGSGPDGREDRTGGAGSACDTAGQGSLPFTTA